jgi:hypothetical protein
MKGPPMPELDQPARPYADPDLVRGYLSRRGVKTFHVANPAKLESGLTVCGLTMAELIDAGWARGLRRRGLNLCKPCANVVDLDGGPEADE